MRYVAAYLLAVLGGNKNPSNSDLEKILGAVGLEVDNERLSKVVSELKGKDVNQVMSKGMSKLASIPSGAPAPSGGSGTGAGGDGATEAKKEEEKKKEESEEESDDDMGFGLFD